MLGALLDMIFPPVCTLCEDSLAKGVFCASCLGRLSETVINPPVCSTCGTPFAAGNTAASLYDGYDCGDCIKTPPPFGMARSVYLYEGAILDAIHALKYQGRTNLAPPLGELLYGAAAELDVKADVVVPVPLHKRRLRSRGFNHSLLIARRLARRLGCGVDATGLKRVRMTEPQVNLSGRERHTNVAGAFAVTDAVAFNGKEVLLVDDVYTTGATVRECARPLRLSGARVTVLTLARVAKV